MNKQYNEYDANLSNEIEQVEQLNPSGQSEDSEVYIKSTLWEAIKDIFNAR